tara:strand:+ start:170 stop:562 length:393 start_codon:yes stop_codon:yes gene_type:complete
MGYLLIKQLHPAKLQLKENSYSYKLLYKTPYLTLNKILFTISDYTIRNVNKDYLITIQTEKELSNIQLIDQFLKYKIQSKPLLTGNKFYFKNNKYINDKLCSGKTSEILYVTLFTIKKNAYQSSPIVYLL